MSMAPFVVFWQASDLPRFDVDYASSFAAGLTLDFTPKVMYGSARRQSTEKDIANPISRADSPYLVFLFL